MRKCKLKIKLHDWPGVSEYALYPQLYRQMSVNFSIFDLHIFSADIAPETLKLCRITKVKGFFLVLVYVLDFDLFEFSAAILGKGLFTGIDSD